MAYAIPSFIVDLLSAMDFRSYACSTFRIHAFDVVTHLLINLNRMIAF